MQGIDIIIDQNCRPKYYYYTSKCHLGCFCKMQSIYTTGNTSDVDESPTFCCGLFIGSKQRSNRSLLAKNVQIISNQSEILNKTIQQNKINDSECEYSSVR